MDLPKKNPPRLMVRPGWPSALLDIDGWIAIKLNPRFPNWFLVDFILGKLDFSLVASWGVTGIRFEREMEMLREGNRDQPSVFMWWRHSCFRSSLLNHCFCSRLSLVLIDWIIDWIIDWLIQSLLWVKHHVAHIVMFKHKLIRIIIKSCYSDHVIPYSNARL